jgi:TRAP-type mannitol/chloroaromatic compound transport system permease large subunit
MILLGIIAIFLLMLLGTPLFIVFSGLTLFLLFFGHIDSSAMIIEMHRIATTPILVAIPLFTFAGYLLSESGAPRRLIRLTDALLGWLPGGLSIIVLATCASFTALTGATGITIIALGGILYPALLQGKYPEKFFLGLVTNSGTLGLLFHRAFPYHLCYCFEDTGKSPFLAGILGHPHGVIALYLQYS